MSTPQDTAEHKAEAITTESREASSVSVGEVPATVNRLPFGITLPTGARSLDPREEITARGVYGASISYGNVVVTDATGGGGRPFTTVLPLGFVAMNLGGASAPPVSRGLLIHELAHVWQSQHHPESTAFMINSIASQTGAKLAGGDAYCSVSGKWFGEFGRGQHGWHVRSALGDKRRARRHLLRRSTARDGAVTPIPRG